MMIIIKTFPYEMFFVDVCGHICFTKAKEEEDYLCTLDLPGKKG